MGTIPHPRLCTVAPGGVLQALSWYSCPLGSQPIPFPSARIVDDEHRDRSDPRDSSYNNMTRRAPSSRVRTRWSGSGTGATVSAEGTAPISGVRTRARGCRRRQFGSARIGNHPAGGIRWLRVTAHAFARVTNRRESLPHVSDANVARRTANGTKMAPKSASEFGR